MRKLNLTVIALLAAFSVFDCCASEIDLKSAIDEVLVDESLTGVAWTLVGGKGEVSLGTAGFRDNPSQTAFTVNTRFHVGSVTKSLLATGVLRLATQGLVDLDSPATRYLHYLSFDNSWEGVAEVTVRHLLDHTSGLNDAHMWQMFSERPGPDTPLIDAFPEPETQLRIRSRPGTRFSYSNMGYTLLGMIIESVVGGRYEAYLDKYLLDPLAMHDSTFAFTTQEGEHADPALAWGHVDDGSRYPASPIFLRPAGQFTSTVEDLATFAGFLMSNGVINGQQFIKQELMLARGKPYETDAANNGLIAGYALGLGRRDRHGVVGYCHGGNIVGFVAMLCLFPEEHKAFAYSVNTDSETANYGRIDRLLIDALNVSEASPPEPSVPAPDIAKWQGRYILSPNRFQSFEYLDNVFGAVKVSAEGSSMVMEAMQRSSRLLRPVGDRLYSANDRATTSHVFLQGEREEFLISDGFRTYEKVPTAYLAAHWTSVVLGLSGLTWLLLSGLLSIVRYRTGFLKRPVAPAFLAILFLCLPLPFFLTQSFMALGDFTFASALLAAVTLMLPIGMIWTITRAGKKWEESRTDRVNGLAAIFVLQWCVVLFWGELLPLRLWA